MVSSKRDTLKYWHQAINHEELANLKQSWHQAVPVTLNSLKRGKKGYRVMIQAFNMPGWFKKGEWVSFGSHPQDLKLIEAKILEKNSETHLCILHVNQREIEQAMSHDRDQWLLPFSTIPYNLMHERIEEIQTFSVPLAHSLLTKETVSAPALNVIQGPPGTGKTTTIAENCLEIYQNAKVTRTKDHAPPKILLTALTHKACVNMAEKLDTLKIPFITMKLRGLPSPLQAKYDLDHLTERVLQEIGGHHLGSNNGRQKRAIQRQILNQIQFVISTAMTAPKRFPVAYHPPFQLVIVDEGSQIPLPLLAGVVSLAEKTIVFGDPIQLPPVVIAPFLGEKEKFQVNPLTYTIYNKVSRQKVELLDKQYRGRPEIFLLVSALFYNGLIRTGRYLPPLLDYAAVEFIDSSTGECQEVNRINYEEANICQGLIDELATSISPHSPPIRVGIVSPFRSQASYLRHELQSPSPSILLDSGTVHVTQGRTYDYLILSLAATTLSPFLNPPERWLRQLHHSLPTIFHRLQREAASAIRLNYPDYRPHLDLVYHQWCDYLEPFLEDNEKGAEHPSQRLRLFEDAEMDLVFDLEALPRLPENDFAANILNVALSRARHRLVIVGHYDVLHQNPLVNLIHSWVDIFGQVVPEPLSSIIPERIANNSFAIFGNQMRWKS
ncbi:MAG: DEAD/DEAH box helicase [Candidatus Thorarchaeota archaeon]